MAPINTSTEKPKTKDAYAALMRTTTRRMAMKSSQEWFKHEEKKAKIIRRLRSIMDINKLNQFFEYVLTKILEEDEGYNGIAAICGQIGAQDIDPERTIGKFSQACMDKNFKGVIDKLTPAGYVHMRKAIIYAMVHPFVCQPVFDFFAREDAIDLTE
jgi:ribosomal protein L36